MKNESTPLTAGQLLGQARAAAANAAVQARLVQLRGQAVCYTKPGGSRRRAILDYLATGNQLPVNSKYQLQVARDPDVRRLLKEKKIVLVRGNYRRGYRFHKGSARVSGLAEGEMVKRAGKHQSYLALPATS